MRYNLTPERKRSYHTRKLFEYPILLSTKTRDNDWFDEIMEFHSWVLSLRHLSDKNNTNIYFCNDEEFSSYLLTHNLEGCQMTHESYNTSNTKEKSVILAIYIPKPVAKDDFHLNFIFETNQGFYDFKGRVSISELVTGDFQLLPTQPQAD